MKRLSVVMLLFVTMLFLSCGKKENPKVESVSEEASETSETWIETEETTSEETLTETSMEDVFLSIASEEKNQIIDEDGWFVKNDLIVPERGPFDLGEKTKVSSYLMSEKGDSEYADKSIMYAVEDEGIVYIEIAHQTYSEWGEHTAFLLAVEKNTGDVLWQSDYLVANAKNFLLIGDVIISGYGFSEEADFLYRINKNTGEILGKIPVKTIPYYIIQKDDLIYVRTYDTDYTFYYQAWDRTEEIPGLDRIPNEEIKEILKGFVPAYFNGDEEEQLKYVTDGFDRRDVNKENYNFQETKLMEPDIFEENQEASYDISIPFLFSQEDSYTYLVISLVKEDEKWGISWYGLDK